MARKLRLEYPGAIYHLMNRGDRREPIFRDDTDRQRFLETLGQACGKTDWQVHAFCLMSKRKLRIARRLREETTMTLAWIARRLRMGSKTHLAHLLYWQQRGETEK